MGAGWAGNRQQVGIEGSKAGFTLSRARADAVRPVICNSWYGDTTLKRPSDNGGRDVQRHVHAARLDRP
jgi:hypothetical protein